MQRNWSVVLVIPICIVVSCYFHCSLVVGGNSLMAPPHHAASFDPPRDHIIKNITINKTTVGAIRSVAIEKHQKDQKDNKYRHIPFEKLSSVDSFTCCGLGHRLARLVNAAHVASQVNFALRAFWDFCGDVEVFYHFFGPQPREEMVRVNSTGTVLRIHNEVPGYRKLVREGPNMPCKCTRDKVDFDSNFYLGLRDRFRNKPEVDSFVESNFRDHNVIGLHVRAGNGERGDFEEKNRMINDVDAWVGRIAKNILNMTRAWNKSPLLYIATDTPAMVQKFQLALGGVMNVTYLPQQRSEEGYGVFFGERGKIHKDIREKNKCLIGWDSVIRDMLILSHTDVVIAARPSSFTQTLPMSIVLNKSKEHRTVMRPFCECNLEGTGMRCFEDHLDWCCNGHGSFVFAGINQRYDYPKVPFELEKQKWAFTRRPHDCNLTAADGLAQRDCIPYSWPALN